MNLLSFSLLLVVSTSVFADKNKSYKGNEIAIQYAGDIGKYSIGYGKRFNDIYTLRLFYGIVPSNKLQNKIETYSIKNNFSIFYYDYKKLRYSLYLGLGLNHVPGDKYKTNELAETPDDYYRQSSLRGSLYIGHEIEYNKISSIYFESSINDVWIINSINNDTIDYKDHVTLGVGVTYKFE